MKNYGDYLKETFTRKNIKAFEKEALPNETFKQFIKRISKEGK